MSNDLYNKIMEEMSTPKVVDVKSTPYQVNHMFDAAKFSADKHYTLDIAHYLGRLQRSSQPDQD